MNIALALMMKNEMPRIPRLMASLDEHNLIAKTIVVDTGSTDGGPEWFEKRPNTEVHRIEWDGFGPGRTALMAAAHQKADWLLCLDADDVLVLPNGPVPFLRWLENVMAAGEHTSVGVASIYPFMKFYLPRLVSGRTAEPWKFVGRAHEYMAGTNAMFKTQLIHIVHKGDGADANSRLHRNLKLLQDDARENPNNSRTAFYLGNTLAELGKTKDAVKWYEKRLMLGGFDEETYCAMLYRGRCLESVPDLIMAWKFRPSRAEALVTAAAICKAKGRLEKSAELYRQAAKIPLSDDRLFVETGAYTCPRIL